jgi:hypothetical protein
MKSMRVSRLRLCEFLTLMLDADDVADNTSANLKANKVIGRSVRS